MLGSKVHKKKVRSDFYEHSSVKDASDVYIHSQSTKKVDV